MARMEVHIPPGQSFAQIERRLLLSWLEYMGIQAEIEFFWEGIASPEVLAGKYQLVTDVCSYNPQDRCFTLRVRGFRERVRHGVHDFAYTCCFAPH